MLHETFLNFLSAVIRLDVTLVKLETILMMYMQSTRYFVTNIYFTKIIKIFKQLVFAILISLVQWDHLRY